MGVPYGIMRILALETNIEEIKRRLKSEGEQELLTTHYHGASFFFASIREFFYTILLFFIGVVAWYLHAPMEYVVSMLAAMWFFFVFFTLLKAFIDWQFDFIILTTDRLILVDQTSVIKSKVTPIHHENIASVSSETQFWDIFQFGKIVINLKEGEGGSRHVLRYVPNAEEVAAKISDMVTQYQRVNRTGE